MARTAWLWLDPTVSLILVAVISVGTWRLLKRSIALALDAVPEGIDPAAVRAHLASQPGVASVHDLQIWPMRTTEAALTAHLVMPEGDGDDAFLARLANELHEQFRVEHVTLQVERGDQKVTCELEPGHAIRGGAAVVPLLRRAGDRTVTT